MTTLDAPQVALPTSTYTDQQHTDRIKSQISVNRSKDTEENI